jgi:hypothetical protein
VNYHKLKPPTDDAMRAASLCRVAGALLALPTDRAQILSASQRSHGLANSRRSPRSWRRSLAWLSQAYRQLVANAPKRAIVGYAAERPPTVAKDERAELLDHLNRCRELLDVMRDPAARATIRDLIVFLELKLVAMDGRRTHHE